MAIFIFFFLVFLVISTKLCYSLVAAHRHTIYTLVSSKLLTDYLVVFYIRAPWSWKSWERKRKTKSRR